jgi:shikimate kinase
MMIELCGRKVRVLVHRDNDDIVVEIVNIWDLTYEKPLVLITKEARLKEDVEALIEEITQLLRKAVEKVVKGEVR